MILPEEGKNIVQYNQDKKNLKIPFITYADMESLLEKLHVCHNNPDKSSITKKSKHTTCGYLLFKHCSFDSSKNKHNFLKSADCMKRFRADLKKHTTEIINYKKNEMLPLTEEKIESYNNKILRRNSNALEKTLRKYNFFSTDRKTRNEKTIK